MGKMTNWEDVVGDLTDPLESGGYLGDLLTVSKAHIDDLVMKQRLTQNSAGQVYASMLDSCLQQAVNYSLQRELVEEQVQTAYVERVLKDKQAVIAGIDGALNSTKTLKDADNAYIYSPVYEKEEV